MTCTYESVEAMAEAGWRQEDIEQLELEVELARRKAEAQSYSDGDTLARQQQRIAAAENAVRKEAHDRWHRELEDGQKAINAMVAFHKENPGAIYTADIAEKALAASGPGGHKHLAKQKEV